MKILPAASSSPLASADYLTGLTEVLARIDGETIDRIADAIWRGHGDGRTLYLFGNGGSAALASHFACDLGKGTAFGKRRRLRAISLTENISMMTAWANDSNYQDIFAEQLRNLLTPGDMVMAISASGNSPNVILGLEAAREAGAVLLGLTGCQGGLAKGMCDLCLVVPSDNVQHIEDAHLAASHAISTAVRLRMRQTEEE